MGFLVSLGVHILRQLSASWSFWLCIPCWWTRSGMDLQLYSCWSEPDLHLRGFQQSYIHSPQVDRPWINCLICYENIQKSWQKCCECLVLFNLHERKITYLWNVLLIILEVLFGLLLNLLFLNFFFIFNKFLSFGLLSILIIEFE